jgi:hypothetical protein
MAWSTVDTHIQNPAKRTGKRMAKTRRKMSAKQIKHFGTKRQKAALKARRHAPAKKRNPPKGGGRVISGYGSTVMNPHRKRKRKNPGNHKIVINSARKRRKNPTPMILSWAAGNPAKRRSTVAKSRKRRKVYATAKRSNAGRRRTTKVVHHRRRSNPGSLGRPMDWLQGGAGVIAGVVGTRAIPQMLLGAANTSYTGYAANAVAAVGLGWLTHMLFPNRQVLVTAVIAGGFAGLLSRIIADKTPFGAQLSLTGLGDHGFGLYQKSNFPYPYRVQGARGLPSSNFTWGDGSQAQVSQMTNAGSDSTLAC